jgi:hypothetical protein
LVLYCTNSSVLSFRDRRSQNRHRNVICTRVATGVATRGPTRVATRVAKGVATRGPTRVAKGVATGVATGVAAHVATVRHIEWTLQVSPRVPVDSVICTRSSRCNKDELKFGDHENLWFLYRGGRSSSGALREKEDTGEWLS